MQPHWLIHDINKPVLNLYFQLEFFIRKLDNIFVHITYYQIKTYPIIDTHKNWFRY